MARRFQCPRILAIKSTCVYYSVKSTEINNICDSFYRCFYCMFFKDHTGRPIRIGLDCFVTGYLTSIVKKFSIQGIVCLERWRRIVSKTNNQTVQSNRNWSGYLQGCNSSMEDISVFCLPSKLMQPNKSNKQSSNEKMKTRNRQKTAQCKQDFYNNNYYQLRRILPHLALSMCCGIFWMLKFCCFCYFVSERHYYKIHQLHDLS